MDTSKAELIADTKRQLAMKSALVKELLDSRKRLNISHLAKLRSLMNDYNRRARHITARLREARAHEKRLRRELKSMSE